MSKRILLVGVFFGLVLVSLVGCISNTGKRVLKAVGRGDLCKAVEIYENTKETDLTLLGKIAEALLEREARALDRSRRNASFAQLRLAGTGAKHVLRHLADGKSTSIPRAKALELLSDLGDGRAKETLRGLVNSTEPEIVAAALSSLDPETDKRQILHALQSSSAEVRRGAALLLAGLSSQRDVRISLVKVINQDSNPNVRSAAIVSLTKHAAESSEIIRKMVVDADPRIRLAAIRGLVRTDYTRAEPILDKVLEAETSDEGIEVARFLIVERGTDKKALDLALAYLYRALSASEPVVRAHAAVALDGLPVDLIRSQKLLERLEKEESPMVKLPLAMILLSQRQAKPVVDQTLSELMRQGGVEGAQAAAERAALGDRNALRKLFRLRSSPSIPIRRVAVRLISRRLGHPEKIARSLCDDDPMVRIIAAGAILAVLASD